MTQTGNALNISQAGVVSFDGSHTFTGSSLTQHDVLVGGASNAITSVSPSTSGFVLTSNGTGSNPSFQAVSASGGITSVNGDSGSASPTAGVITLTGGSSGAFFTGSGSTLTNTFNYISMAGTNNTGNGVITFAASPTYTSVIHTYTGGGPGTRPNQFFGDGAGNFTNTGSGNVGIGDLPLAQLVSGNSNVAIGHSTLSNLLTGGANVAIGLNAGNNYTGSESGNILITNSGVAAESNTIRIGTQGSGTAQQNACYIAGITGVGLNTAAVVTQSSGQLGTSTITAGTGISVTAGASTITIATTGTTTLTVTPLTHANTPYTVLSTDDFLAITGSVGSFTVKLPNAPATGKVIIIKDTNGVAATDNILVTTVGGTVTIDGQTTYTMATNYQSLSVIFDGTNYEVF